MNKDISAVCLDEQHDRCGGKFYRMEFFRKIKFACKCQCHRDRKYKGKQDKEEVIQ